MTFYSRLIVRAVLIALLALVVVHEAGAQRGSRGFDVAFVGVAGGPAGVNVMRADGSRLRLSVPEGDAVSSLTRDSWSPDGTSIVLMCACAEDAEMLERYSIPFHFAFYLIRADGSGYRRLLEVPAMPSIAWSPDSRRLLFVSAYEDPRVGQSQEGSNLRSVAHAVYVLDLESRRTTRLTPLGRDAIFPSWSPDGRRVLFSLLAEGPGLARADIHVVNSDGSDLQRLTVTENAWHATWAPRTNRIAVSARDGVFLMRPDGSNIQQVASGRSVSVSWSPDGNTLLIEAASVRLHHVETGAESTVGEQVLDATFTPDGRGVLFRTSPQDGGGIYFVDLQARNQTQIAAGSSFAVSPTSR